MWVLGIDPRLSELAADTLTFWTIFLGYLSLSFFYLGAILTGSKLLVLLFSLVAPSGWWRFQEFPGP